jgi:SAM-dependent methyltransferase
MKKKNRKSRSAKKSNIQKAALRGEPSFIWRAGQERRLRMITSAAESRLHGRVLENGCGVGMYLKKLTPIAETVIGLEVDHEYAREARRHSNQVVRAASERLPYADKTFDLILSHEVIEHVGDDKSVVSEMVRTLRPSGRMVIFCPNRGYPFETHGIFWRGQYHFGNIPLVNYLPRRLRDRLAPHVRVYTQRDLEVLFDGLPVRVITRTVIFGAYDNLISRWPRLGRTLRAILQGLEHTPLRIFGLSHFWVVEKKDLTGSNT